MLPAGQKPLVCGLILAAGLSSRMGEFKPLMPLRGKTLIENTVDSIFSGGAASVTVVVGYRGEEVAALLVSRYGERVQMVWNHDYANTDTVRTPNSGTSTASRQTVVTGEAARRAGELLKMALEGGKGCGELCIIPTAPACAHAYYRYDGKFRQSLPLADTPYRKK